MNPSDIILQIRQRGEWEAVDAGFALVRHLWLNLFPAWLLILGVLSLCCLLLLPEAYIGWAPFIIWWLKPLFDRVLLHILSRNLFNQQPSLAAVFSALPGLIRHTGLLGALSWRRFSLSRSYNLPVWQLEQLRGKAKRARQNLLYLQGHTVAMGLTISCVLLQFTLIFSLYGLVILFDPTGHAWEHLSGLFQNTGYSEYAYWLSVWDFCVQVLAIAIIEPFFVAGGFALYLNRRTQLEAWDIEMTFRSLGERLGKAAAPHTRAASLLLLSTLLLTVLTGMPSEVQAAANQPDNPEYLHNTRRPVAELPAQLQAVMQADELKNRQKVQVWQSKDKTNTDRDHSLPEAFIQLVASILRFVIWAIALLAVVLLIVYRRSLLAMLKPTATHEQDVVQPTVLFGMDIRPESLPDDIAGTAQTLWHKNLPREALSLLYRGSLAQLTRHDQLRIADSHTEGDILELAAAQLSSTRHRYLQQLTRQWQNIAYAHRVPASTEIEPLFEQWQDFLKPDTSAQHTTITGEVRP